MGVGWEGECHGMLCAMAGEAMLRWDWVAAALVGHAAEPRTALLG